MKKTIKVPFQNMTKSGWTNLSVVALFSLYAFLLLIVWLNSTLCENLAIDYCAFWSAGRVINERSIADVYDLSILTEYQSEIYPQSGEATFETLAIMYPPVFVVPFQVLSLIQVPYSFWIWTVINIISFALYLRFFTRDISGRSLPVGLLMMLMLSMPLILNLYFGQVSILLGIFAGEFIRAIKNHKPIKAGIWLGGVLLKPQLLILIIPFLIFQRSFKVLKGFALSSMMVFGISFALIGVDGFIRLTNILIEASGGGVHSKPEIMMNWRMLGWHVESFTSPTFGWIVILLGSLLTIGIIFSVFRRRIMCDPDLAVISILGILAASNVIAWHSHFHLSIILIPPILFIILKLQVKKKILLLWVLLPVVIQIIIFLVAPVLTIERQLLQILEGVQGLILNLIILSWAINLFSLINNDPSYEALL